ncbi:MAG: right-handed parallel beta-helix repeat-containing protein [Deltaproteobacteria bacterium]|nr:right-handed parallel beta-helix repeat-containing protein [Deltaproteobacteria bacterium]
MRNAFPIPGPALALLALVALSLPACSTLHFEIESASLADGGANADSDASDGASSDAVDASTAAGEDASTAAGEDASTAAGEDASTAAGEDASAAAGEDASAAAGEDASTAAGEDASTAAGEDASTAAGEDASSCGAPATGVVLPLYPANGASWNDYVSHSAPAADAFHQPDLPCLGTEANYYACIHGAEFRRVVVPLLGRCTSLSARDALGAFDWVCNEFESGLVFVSTGFARGMGLSDLLEADSFKTNSFTVMLQGCPVFQTPPAIWWSNPVRPLPLNSSSSDPPLVLAEEGTVYTAPETGQVTSGYNLAGDRIAVVTLGQGVLAYSGRSLANCVDPSGTIPVIPGPYTYKTLVCTGGHKHLWIEGRMAGTGGAETLVFLARTSLSRVHRSELWGGGGEGLSAGLSVDDGSRANLVTEVRAHDNEDYGISLFRADANILMDCVMAHNGTGVRVEDGCQGNCFLRLTSIDNMAFGFLLTNRNGGDPLDGNVLAMNAALFNGEEGFSLQGVRFSSLQASLSAHNDGDGIGDTTGLTPSFNALTNCVLVNDVNGLILTSSQNELKDVVLAHHQGVGVVITGDANQVRGLLGVGNNSSGDCSVAVTSTGNLLDGSCDHGEGLATPPLLDLSLPASFLGPLDGNDALNATAQSQGSAPATAVTDWVAFENPLRAWGPEGPFLSMTARGPCTSGNCHVYDQRLLESDTVLRSAYGVFVPGAPCPSAADASNPENILQSASLATGIELVGDRLRNPQGNNNGLCESNEGCLFTPNLGAYQGEGDLSEVTCHFTGGGGLAGVRLYGFTSNGSAGP